MTLQEFVGMSCLNILSQWLNMMRFGLGRLHGMGWISSPGPASDLA